jgi:2-polyprenyl-3-methyl-5-hydroxy-6-metoxy-1,4-benzoquinol methylase
MCIRDSTRLAGCDSDEDSINFCRDRFGLGKDVVCQDLLSFVSDQENGFCDVILLIDVIEHLPADIALQLMCLLRSKLPKGGRVLIQTPNAFSLFQPTFWGDLTHSKLYSTASLSQLFNLSGFEAHSFFAMPCRVHTVSSAVRRVMWELVVRPAILLFHLVAYGNRHGGIYTANFLARCDV